MAGCKQEFSSHAQGTKGYALISGPGGHRSQARIHKGQGSNSDLAWMFGQREGARPTSETNPYQDEWERLMDAIKNDKPHNEVERGVQASVVTSMGRMAAHVGTEVTYDQMLNSAQIFAPGVENLNNWIRIHHFWRTPMEFILSPSREKRRVSIKLWLEVKCPY